MSTLMLTLLLICICITDAKLNNGIIGLVMSGIYPGNNQINENVKSQSVINIIASEDTKPNEEKIEITEENTETEEETESEKENVKEPENPNMEVISRNAMTGNRYTMSQLSDYNYVHDHFYTITSVTALTESMLRPDEFVRKDLSVSHGNETPQILIFHSHSQEAFADSPEGDKSKTIVAVGNYLTKILTEKYGYNVIHDTSEYDIMGGALDRSKAYTYSEQGILSILSDNPSVDVVIDLHRDGVNENTHLVTDIDGVKMAKLMFFNGLCFSNINGELDNINNPYRDDNLAMSLQMQIIGQAYYPGLLRNIYCNAYKYCLDKRGKSMLIEAGAQTNTFEEVKNSMEPLSDILNKLLTGQEKSCIE